MKKSLILLLSLTINIWASNRLARLNFDGRVVSQLEIDQFKNLNKASFVGASLDGIKFNHKNMYAVNFKQAVLKNCQFINCNLENANFTKAQLDQVVFSGAGTGLNILNSKFDQAVLTNCTGLVKLLDHNQALATNSSFKGASFIDNSMLANNNSFYGIRLQDNYDFSGAVFSGDRMNFARAEFGPKVNFANTKFNGVPCDFSMEALDVMPTGSYDNNRKGLIFFETKILGTNFSGAEFNYVNFSYLQAANANLRKAIFNNCKMLVSILSGDLSCTKFNGGIIKVNDFTGAKITGSELVKWTERDADGSNSTNIFSPGHVYDKPVNLDQFACLKD